MIAWIIFSRIILSCFYPIKHYGEMEESLSFILSFICCLLLPRLVEISRISFNYFILVFGVFFTYLVTRPNISRDVGKWETLFSREEKSTLPVSTNYVSYKYAKKDDCVLQVPLYGIFHLVAVDENYAAYLKQLEIPDIAIALIMSS